MQRYPKYFIIMTKAGFHRFFLKGGDGAALVVIPTHTSCGSEFELTTNFPAGLIKFVHTHPFQVHGINLSASGIKND